MTELNTIFENNFDSGITTTPDFFDGNVRSINTIKRGVTTLLANTEDEIQGVIDRRFYDRDAYDGYICELVARTLSDAKNIIKGLKKVCATYTPTSEENILQWEEGDWTLFTRARYEFRFIVLVRRAVIQAF